MKHVKLFKQYVNEKIEYSYSTVNGKKIESSWSGSADSLKDFIKLIKEIPETLQSIKVQTGTSSFNPESTWTSVKEGAFFNLENIVSNLFVKFSNIL